MSHTMRTPVEALRFRLIPLLAILTQNKFQIGFHLKYAVAKTVYEL